MHIYILVMMTVNDQVRQREVRLDWLQSWAFYIFVHLWMDPEAVHMVLVPGVYVPIYLCVHMCVYFLCALGTVGYVFFFF